MRHPILALDLPAFRVGEPAANLRMLIGQRDRIGEGSQVEWLMAEADVPLCQVGVGGKPACRPKLDHRSLPVLGVATARAEPLLALARIASLEPGHEAAQRTHAAGDRRAVAGA